jgi:hypothetical protein
MTVFSAVVMSTEPTLRPFLDDNVIDVLNVACPRAGKKPSVHKFVTATLDRV